MKKLSLVVPVYFEEECISQFVLETRAVLNTLPISYEYVFVDDGSRDRTAEMIRAMAAEDERIKLVEFSYNHGKQAAVTAGIHYATGDYLLYMDPDLQDPPVEIPRFIEEIEKGYNLVFGVREEKMDSALNKLFSAIFWSVLERFTGLKLPRGLAVMRIFDRKFANAFVQYGEQNRFIEGIFMHISMKRTQIVISQRARFAGQSKFNFRRKMKLAFDAILDFSELPLKIAVRLGLLFTLIGLLGLLGIAGARLSGLDFQAGWPSLFGMIVLGTGLNLTFTGIVALYIGRIYREVKKRPLFSVKQTTNLPQAR